MADPLIAAGNARYLDKKKPAAPLPAGSSQFGTANSAPRADGQPGLTPTTPVGGYQAMQPIAAMSPADRLLIDSNMAGANMNPGGRSNAVTTAGGIAGTAAAGNAGLNALQGQILTTPGSSLAQTIAANPGVGNNGRQRDLLRPGAAAPVTSGRAAPGAGLQPSAASLYQQPNQGPLSTGTGQGSLDEVDAALTGYDARFAVPGTVQAEARPGTGQMGAIPGNVAMGALPGATDRGVQMSALDRVLGFDPSVGTSVAQAQLRDAAQGNLSQSLAMARSARGGPAAQAQAMRMAQAEGAATMSQAARDAAILRAKEEDTRKARELEALGLGGELSTQIRGSDVLERGQNVGALEAELTAGVTQRGQTIGNVEAERNAGVLERGQTLQSQDNTLNAGVTQRGQTINANQAMSQQELDALVARGGLAQTERQVGATERGQTLDAILGTEQVKQARDAVASSALTEGEKIEANILMTRAQLGYQLTPEQQFRAQQIANKANDPTLMQYILGGVQAGANTAQAVASVAKGGGTG